MVHTQSFRTVVRLAGIATAVLGAGVGFASADTHFITGVNDTTGFGSLNLANHNLTITRTHTLNNNSTASNNFTLSSTPGNVNASNNTTLAGVTTGRTSFSGGATTNLNSGSTLVAALPMDVNIGGQQGNFTTGSQSDNEATFNGNINDQSNITRQGNVTNNANATVTSGTITATGNTQLGRIMTGGVNGSLNYVTSINAGQAAAVQTAPAVNVDSSNTNHLTGANSRNITTTNLNLNNNMSEQDTGSVANNINFASNPGNVNVSNNTLGGDVVTGDTSFNFTTMTNVNGQQ